MTSGKTAASPSSQTNPVLKITGKDANLSYIKYKVDNAASYTKGAGFNGTTSQTTIKLPISQGVTDQTFKIQAVIVDRQEMKAQQRPSTIIILTIPRHPIMHRKMETSRITMERTRSAGRKKNFQTVSVMPFIVERAKTLHHRKKILSRHPSRTLTAQIPRSQMEPSGIIRYAHKKLQQKER